MQKTGTYCGGVSGGCTLIHFGKFEDVTVLIAKAFYFDSNLVISTQWTLKRPKRFVKAKFFSKAKKFKFYDFFSDLGWFANNYSEKVIGLSKKATKAAKRQ